jgi:hypothetical protein
MLRFQIFSQDRLVTTTSPVTPSTPSTTDCLRTPTLTGSCQELIITPRAKGYHAMSQSQDHIDQNKLSPSNPYFPRPSHTHNGTGQSASRTSIRNPAPPSPLSQIQPNPGESLARSVPTPSSSTAGPSASASGNVPPSPCFIHSHLDRTGTLQNWLQGSGSEQSTSNRPTTHHRNGHMPNQASSSRHPKIPVHQARQIVTRAQAPQDASSAGSSRVTSPTSRKEASMSGYESDKSSALGGSALFEGDFMDDDDDTGSLTRQLAETAQGVREMSKQLGTLALHVWLMTTGFG